MLMQSPASSKRPKTPSPPSEGKPTNNNLLAIRETLLPLLLVIPYDQLLGVHSITAILPEAAKYKADHGSTKFIRPSRLPLYNKNIADDATTVVRVRAKAAHKSCLDNYASYKAAKCGVVKFLCNVVGEIWCNNLKDAEMFYTKVTALEIMAHLNTNSRGCMPLTDLPLLNHDPVLRSGRWHPPIQCHDGGFPKESKAGQHAHC
jgi:hypothetical protein